MRGFTTAMAQRMETERGFGYIGVFFFFTSFQHCTGYCCMVLFLCSFLLLLLFSSCSCLCGFFLLALCHDWFKGYGKGIWVMHGAMSVASQLLELEEVVVKGMARYISISMHDISITFSNTLQLKPNHLSAYIVIVLDSMPWSFFYNTSCSLVL
ncbi:hypothetical protein V8C42DRAFT_36298 [Trichoderma barbatum]